MFYIGNHRDVFKGVQVPLGLIFEDFVHFLKKLSIIGQSILWIWLESSKELKNHGFPSVKIIVLKLHQKMCKNQYFPCFEPKINNHLS